MNIQIFGKSKCFDTKKAERYFKERRIPYQMIDLKRYGMSGREFDSVLKALVGIDKLIDWEGKDGKFLGKRFCIRNRILNEAVYFFRSFHHIPIILIAFILV